MASSYAQVASALNTCSFIVYASVVTRQARAGQGAAAAGTAAAAAAAAAAAGSSAAAAAAGGSAGAIMDRSYSVFL